MSDYHYLRLIAPLSVAPMEAVEKIAAALRHVSHHRDEDKHAMGFCLSDGTPFDLELEQMPVALDDTGWFVSHDHLYMALFLENLFRDADDGRTRADHLFKAIESVIDGRPGDIVGGLGSEHDYAFGPLVLLDDETIGYGRSTARPDDYIDSPYNGDPLRSIPTTFCERIPESGPPVTIGIQLPLLHVHLEAMNAPANPLSLKSLIASDKVAAIFGAACARRLLTEGPKTVFNGLTGSDDLKVVESPEWIALTLSGEFRVDADGILSSKSWLDEQSGTIISLALEVPHTLVFVTHPDFSLMGFHKPRAPLEAIEWTYIGTN